MITAVSSNTCLSNTSLLMLIVQKHFKQKSLVILRACNELLRRLSRAEDTVFCGRVVIFMFQSFPLGDRSSVNLRGEYHVENVTVYEDIRSKLEAKVEDGMDVDRAEIYDGRGEEATKEAQPATGVMAQDDATQAMSTSEDTKMEMEDGRETKGQQESARDMDTLYPTFWSLQESFSTPTRLFDDAKLSSFQAGLEATMHKFKEAHQELSARGTTKVPDEGKRATKRKGIDDNDGDDEVFSASFNPKYLTSRDLFDLEISDLAFRRHILVQALVLIDFLLSLTIKAKKKLEATSNKSVLYSYTLSEDNTKWATNMRSEIANYLQQGPEGKFYYRMVDTVLSRDKNWVYWKAEGCPPIQRDPISAQDFASAENCTVRACTNKKLRTTPLGTLDLKFLSDTGESDGMAKLRNPETYTIDAFQRPIADDDFELEMARTKEEKQSAADAKASKLWRLLRIASKNKLSLFEKIEDGDNLKPLFEPEEEEAQGKADLPSTMDQPDNVPTSGAMDSLSKENGVRVSQESGVA